jgi:hypothetical protein
LALALRDRRIDGATNNARIAHLGVADTAGFGNFLLGQSNVFCGSKVGACDLAPDTTMLGDLAAGLGGIVFVGKAALAALRPLSFRMLRRRSSDLAKSADTRDLCENCRKTTQTSVVRQANLGCECTRLSW